MAAPYVGDDPWRYCVWDGTPVGRYWRFCPRCGHRLHGKQVSTEFVTGPSAISESDDDSHSEGDGDGPRGKRSASRGRKRKSFRMHEKGREQQKRQDAN